MVDVCPAGAPVPPAVPVEIAIPEVVLFCTMLLATTLLLTALLPTAVLLTVLLLCVVVPLPIDNVVPDEVAPSEPAVPPSCEVELLERLPAGVPEVPAVPLVVPGVVPLICASARVE